MLLYHQLWLSAFVLTQLVEAPLYYWALSAQRAPHLAAHQGPRWARIARRTALSLAPSAMTHPLLWMLWPALARPLGLSQWTLTCTGEVLVWLIEGLMLWTLGLRRPWGWSFVANAISALLFPLWRVLIMTL